MVLNCGFHIIILNFVYQCVYYLYISVYEGLYVYVKLLDNGPDSPETCSRLNDVAGTPKLIILIWLALIIDGDIHSRNSVLQNC